MGRRLMMIGWDGADRRLVEHLLGNGALPALAGLRDRGVMGQVVPLPGLADDGSWSTFATGVGPGVHGRFHHHQIGPGSYRVELVVRDCVGVEPFWAAIAAGGHRVLALDVPKAPLGAVPGVVVLADWMPHGPITPPPWSFRRGRSRPATWPRGLRPTATRSAPPPPNSRPISKRSRPGLACAVPC